MSLEPRGSTASGELAIYELEMRLTFVGNAPAEYNRAAPEVSDAHHAAVAAAKAALVDHGFTVGGGGHGSRRIGTGVPESHWRWLDRCPGCGATDCGCLARRVPIDPATNQEL